VEVGGGGGVEGEGEGMNAWEAVVSCDERIRFLSVPEQWYLVFDEEK
jgi:hypothetical protein